ncbi:MAG: hypothetical protein O6761_02475 [Thaumarchaeota archaeon]|nr:hypothetical protein [Nitrososphaerota archaeon]
MKTIPYMDFRNKRRAVAPIIATLLMVAIAVVGGILIFVFAQGFFTDINVGAPNIELLEIYGYDARDTVNLAFHTGDELAVSIAADGKLSDNDAFTVYVRNRGNTAVIIEKVKVFGATYLQTATPVACSTTAPVAQTFLMIDEDTIADDTAPINAVLSDCALSFYTIGANAEATIILRYEDSVNNGASVKIGRPIPIVIQTGNGGSFIKQLQNGVRL